MSSHDIFTGSAGMGGQASDGWTHTVPDAVPVMCGRPERYAAARPAADPAFPWFWLAVTIVCLLVLAAVSRAALGLVLDALRALGWLSW